MRTPEQIAAWCENVVLDTRFAAVRDWRARTGRKVIGHLPVYAPREIVEAAGMLPVAVFGGGDQVEIIRGDAYFQSYICQIPRSVVEMGLTGALDCFDGMLFPATCDVIRNLSGMWQLLFPDRYVRYLDLPHDHHWEVGGRFWVHELHELGRGLAVVSGITPTPERLRDAIRRHDESRRLMRELYDLRSDAPHRVPTSEAYLVVRAGLAIPVDDHNELLREYMEAARARERPELDQSRVVIVGAFCEQPPLGLIKTLERSGCYIVDDDLALGPRLLREDVGTAGDPWESIARAWFDRASPTASRFQPGEKKGEWLVRRVRERKAEGVVFCAASFCDPALLEQPMLQDALDAAGIPHTAFKYAENTAQFGAIHEQAGTFSDSIKLWSDNP